MRFLGAMVFAAVCLGMMVYSLTLRTERRADDRTSHSPLRLARRA